MSLKVLLMQLSAAPRDVGSASEVVVTAAFLDSESASSFPATSECPCIHRITTLEWWLSM